MMIMAEIIVIASGKGGVGKSTITVGLSYALKRLDKKVLVIDFDIGLRSLDLLFGVREKVLYNWGDLVMKRCEKEDVLIVNDGIALIPAPFSNEEKYNESDVLKAVELFDDDFDYILIDAPAGISSGFKLACFCADRALLVSTPDDVCVRSVNAAANKIEEVGIKDVRLVINKFVLKYTLKRKFLNIDDVIDNTEVRLIGIVPFDKKIGFASMNSYSLAKRAKSVKAFHRIAKRIIGEEIPLKV